MFAAAKGVFVSICSAVKNLVGQTFGTVGVKASAAQRAASVFALQKLKKSLEDLRIQMNTAPDVYITIVEVKMQDGLEVDLFNFMLMGLTCRMRLEVTGTISQVAGMAVAQATGTVVSTIPSMITRTAAAWTGFEIEKIVVEGAEKMREVLANRAANELETKSIEFDMHLDFGVRKTGEEVITAVHIATDAFKAIDRVIPVTLVTKHVEEVLERKVKEVVTKWVEEAKSKMRIVVGEKTINVTTSGVGIAQSGIAKIRQTEKAISRTLSVVSNKTLDVTTSGVGMAQLGIVKIGQAKEVISKMSSVVGDKTVNGTTSGLGMVNLGIAKMRQWQLARLILQM